MKRLFSIFISFGLLMSGCSEPVDDSGTSPMEMAQDANTGNDSGTESTGDSPGVTEEDGSTNLVDGTNDTPTEPSIEDGESTDTHGDIASDDGGGSALVDVLSDSQEQDAGISSDDVQGDGAISGDAAEEVDGQEIEDTDLSDGSIEDDILESDAGEEPDTTVEVLPLSPCPGTVTLTAPMANDFIQVEQDTTFQVLVNLDEGVDPDTLQVNWESPDGTVYGESELIEAGNSFTSTIQLSFPNPASVKVIPRISDGVSTCEEGKAVGVHICKYLENEAFPSGIENGWNALNAAYWVNGGDDGTWVELTGNISGQKGFLYNEQVKVTEGSASIQMTFSTGGGINTGADGLAMTVVDVETIEEVLDIIDDAATGGGLGYGVAGAYGPWEGSSLHIEVDTWNNVANGAEKHTDPTPSNHIAIALDGDPGNAVAWTAIPSIEDLQWHTIRVDIDGSSIRVFFDGEETTKEIVEGLDFRGGFIYFSASTGWATNFHRVSELKVLHGCQ